ncbi:hypothetical protein SAMD00019534_052900 [Acytostelium subglobosum LB1]|uniref:hypothetical protein n=1 Tax=Acytostelium subglobosum LB1 TaxID=1410327 RepID=UPI000644E340|nr:hypothetical protein SAMD00019534_052900 [Acytostelium subglobosum LB1]GAM22115.1 hypothetical protein SAMD00019534_052900 [Acytostelium subglobosum LB1]|eukprot:XP_012755215.1 hypothetical protein SAMD00019534_052900 [Acytostelium subglobosum LB1]
MSTSTTSTASTSSTGGGQSIATSGKSPSGRHLNGGVGIQQQQSMGGSAGSPASGSPASQPVPVSVMATSSSPSTGLKNGGSPATPNGANGVNHNHINNNNNLEDSASSSSNNNNASSIKAAGGGVSSERLRIDYKFDEYEDQFFAKAIINDPLKISLIPDLLSVRSVPRDTKIAGQNIPGDLIFNKLSVGVQESINIFKQEWTIITRDAMPTPAAGLNQLKPLSFQLYEENDDFETGTPAESVKDLNQEIVQSSGSQLFDPKIIDTLKTARAPLFQTFFSDESSTIDPPRIGKPFEDPQFFQFQVECSEFRTVIGDIEPFFGRMFLFDANAEPKHQIVSEVFHFDFGTHQNLLPKSTDVEPPAKIRKAVFSVVKPSIHVYLIICFDKVMRGDPEETTKIYFNLPGKPKEISKFQQEVDSSLPRLGHFRQPFVWGSVELFDKDEKFNFSLPEQIHKVANLTRIKGELYNFVTKPEKKLINWCECNLKFSLLNESSSPLMVSQTMMTNTTTGSTPSPSTSPASSNQSLGRIDHLLRPVYQQAPTPLIREVYPIHNAAEQIDMNISYSNVLYFYPKSVNLTNFKSDKGSSARNIFLEIKLLEDDTNVNNSGMKAVFGTSTSPLLTRRFYTTVVYHNKKPEFTDEIKINLPSHLTPNHHLLVTFYHLGCRPSKKNEKPEVCLGHCAIRLFEEDKVIADGKYRKPVATVFPPKYLDMELKEQTNSKMWVDNKKPIFKFRTRVLSTVYPQDPVLAIILKDGAEGDHNLLIETFKRVSEVPNPLKLRFFPVLARIIFKCIVSLSKELQKHALIALITIVDAVSKEMKAEERLTSFATYIHNNSSSSNTLHESLVLTWIQLLESKDEKSVLSLQYAWFLFAVIKKSMIIDIEIKGLLKNGRNRSNRFSEEYLQKFKTLFELLLIQLKQVYSKSIIAKSFITSVAYFINDMMDIMNRGFLFRLINSYVTGLDCSNTVMEMVNLKYTFLKVLASSDSFIALNLPTSYQFPNIVDCYQHFYKKHYLIGLILQEVASSVGAAEKEMRLKAISSLKEIMARFDTSSYFNTPQIRERIASLYFPYVLIVIDNFELISKFDKVETKNWLACFIYVVKNLINSSTNIIADWWKKEVQKKKIVTFFNILSTCANMFDYMELSKEVVESSSSTDKPDSSAVDSPKGKGKVSIKKAKGNPEATKMMLEQYTNNLSGKSERSISVTHSSDRLTQTPGGMRAFSNSLPMLNVEPAITAEVMEVMAGNLAHEVSMTILNCIIIYIKEFKDELHSLSKPLPANSLLQKPSDKQTVTLERLFKSLIVLIKKEQSHAFIKVAFQSIASILTEFKTAVFKNNNSICADLTPEVFKYFSKNHAPNRQAAATLAFLMILNNLKECGQFSRMKLQSTVSISKIVSDSTLTDFEYLFACLESITKFVKQYCNNNLLRSSAPSFTNSAASGPASSPTKVNPLLKSSPVQPVSQPSAPRQQAPISQQIEELRDRLFGVIKNSVKIKQHDYDPEMKADLFHQMSNTFSESPDLRITWLKSLANFLHQTQNWEEAAQTYIITAALVCGYLKQLKRFPKNLAVDFSNVSPNITSDLILPDSSLLEAVEGEVCQLVDFTEPGFIALLKDAIQELKRGSFFESCVETYQLLLPTFQKNREWKRQYECYSELVMLCNQMISESTINQRLFANYYRVAFYGESLIPEMHNKEYIYKELNFVRLSELSDRLQKQYGTKFGEDKIHLLPNNKPVDKGSLNPQHIYFQIVSVDPYLLPEELKERVSTFDQNTNLNKFIFEVPFTKSGKAHSENITEQWKRKTVLTTEAYFPYLKKRLLIVKKEEIELTPIEASYEIIQKKTQALRAELKSALPNTKTLQINLQGSLLLQVNAGPLAIASSFLGGTDFEKYNAEHYTKLQESYKEFTNALAFSLKLNKNLTKAEDTNGLELQAQLEKGYKEFRDKIKQYVNLDQTEDQNNN